MAVWWLVLQKNRGPQHRLRSAGWSLCRRQNKTEAYWPRLEPGLKGQAGMPLSLPIRPVRDPKLIQILFDCAAYDLLDIAISNDELAPCELRWDRLNVEGDIPTTKVSKSGL